MLIEAIKALAGAQGLALTEKKGVCVLERVVAERRALLGRKRLTYRAKFRIVEDKKEVHFSELLKESGFGLSMGHEGLSPGFGFRKQTYKTGLGPREGSIEEQSRLLGRVYAYTFDFGTVRNALEGAARDAGYTFHWKFVL